MFDDLLESTNEKKKTNKGWGFILSGVVQALILAILILIPLIYTEALPKAMLSTLLIAPPPPPPPPPPPAVVKTIIKPVARLIQSGKLMQPRAIPKEVAVFKEAELPPDVINNWRCDGRRVWRHPGTGHGRRSGATSTEADGSHARQAGRQRDGCVDPQPDSSGLPRFGAAGPHSRQRRSSRHH